MMPPVNHSAAPIFEQYKGRNTSHVDPLTQRVLPTVNPLAEVPRQVRTGQVQAVKFNISTDPRGDIDHLVGAAMPSSSADPRAFGALDDRQQLANLFTDDRLYQIPRNDLDSDSDEEDEDVVEEERYGTYN